MLESLDYTHYITGAAQPKLTSENLMNITVIIPSPPEQTQIADFLDRKTQQIDELISAEAAKNRTPQRIPSIPHLRSGNRQDRCPKRGVDHADV